MTWSVCAIVFEAVDWCSFGHYHLKGFTGHGALTCEHDSHQGSYDSRNDQHTEEDSNLEYNCCSCGRV